MTALPPPAAIGELGRAGRAAAGLVALIDGFAEFTPPAGRELLNRARESAGQARQLLLEGAPLSRVWLAIGQGVMHLERVASAGK